MRAVWFLIQTPHPNECKVTILQTSGLCVDNRRCVQRCAGLISPVGEFALGGLDDIRKAVRIDDRQALLFGAPVAALPASSGGAFYPVGNRLSVLENNNIENRPSCIRDRPSPLIRYLPFADSTRCGLWCFQWRGARGRGGRWHNRNRVWRGIRCCGYRRCRQRSWCRSFRWRVVSKEKKTRCQEEPPHCKRDFEEPA